MSEPEFASPSTTFETLLDPEDYPDILETPLPHTVISTVLLCVSLGFIIGATIVGNVLVCVSVCFVRRLRRPSNYLLVSLAVSDLCVAVLVMPLALHLEVTGLWTLGARMCDVWIALDMTCCTASILNLCAISIDRYLTISRPLTYGVNKKARWVWLSIAIVWLSAALISVPPMITLGNEYGTLSEPRCDVSQNLAYQLYATLGSFYIPLIVILLMYCKIYITARGIVKSEKMKSQHDHVFANEGRKTKNKAKNTSECSVDNLTEENVTPSERNNKSLIDSKASTPTGSNKGKPLTTASTSEKQRVIKPTNNKTVTKRESGSSGNANNGTNKVKRKSSSKCQLDQMDDDSSRRSIVSLTPSVFVQSQRGLPKSRMAALLKERKASFTLGIILVAFTMCWLPFFAVALLRALLQEWLPVPDALKTVVLWLGYANSMLNPVIYVTFHKDFRKSFKEIICFRCRTVNQVFRQEASKEQCVR